MTPEAAKAAGAILVSKDQLFERADILTIHLVLSSRTRGLVGAAELEKMKPTAWLINASRGPIVEEQALISVLKNKQIAGAAIDVFNIEPLPASHSFRTLDNVLATPHIGYVSQGLCKTFYEDTSRIFGSGSKPIKGMSSNSKSATSLARAVSDEELSREILETVGELLKNSTVNRPEAKHNKSPLRARHLRRQLA